jgi:AcrR family transcriptional regulator
MDQESDPSAAPSAALPAVLQAAWGLRDRPGKGPKPGLSLERIVAAAIATADSDGLAAVSMGRVAARLGASTMSLYRYVAAKDELLEHMQDTAFGTPPPPAPDEGWREGLSAWGWAILAAYRRHTWTLALPLGGIPTMPNQVAWMESALRVLRGTGLSAGERLSVLMLVAGYVRNQATMESQIAAAFVASYASADEAMSAYSGILRSLIDPHRFPELSDVLASGVVDRADGPDDEFTFGMDRILDGIEVLVTARSQPPRKTPGQKS